MANALIQGASRGIGLQFCKHLLDTRSSLKIIATCRRPEEATELQQLRKENPQNLEILQLDVANEDQIKDVSSAVKQLLHGNPASMGGLDLLINCAGILHPSGRGETSLKAVSQEILQLDVANEDQIKDVSSAVKQLLHGNPASMGGLDLLINCAGILHPSGRGETSLKAVSQEALMSTFATNTIGPLLMAKHFGEFLTKGGGEFGKAAADGGKPHSAVLVNMSARVGSITDNKLGGWYSYRMSKSALNSATKNLSVEFSRGRKKIICISLHPGTVDTELSRPYHRNVPEGKLFSAEYSVKKMMEVVENVSVDDSGKFFDFAGLEIPF